MSRDLNRPGSLALPRRRLRLVCFDLLAAGGADVRRRPLWQRRRLLEQVLSTVEAPIVRRYQAR